MAPLLDSIAESTPGARVLFLADPRDPAECAAIRRERRGGRPIRVDVVTCGGNYASKINRGVELTSEPLLFLGADDLKFHSGWFEAAKSRLGKGVEVVGVNDLCSRRVRQGRHATHFLMTRAYAELPAIDNGRGPLCEVYEHSCVDDELVATAQHRGVLRFASDAIVEHIHPDAGKALWDGTYEKGRAGMRQDLRRFERRKALWR